MSEVWHFENSTQYDSAHNAAVSSLHTLMHSCASNKRPAGIRAPCEQEPSARRMLMPISNTKASDSIRTKLKKSRYESYRERRH